MRTNQRSERLRRARERGTHTVQEWALLRIATGEVCPRCKNSEYRHELDHIVPIYQDGSDLLENIQPLCARCNSSKGPESIDYRPVGIVDAIRNALASGRIAELLINACAEVDA